MKAKKQTEEWIQICPPPQPISQNKLLTKAEYDKLKPYQQGYIHYMQEAHPGSELAGLPNPYSRDSKEHSQWDEGQMAAMLDVQDQED
jgi:hypothetical protein